MPPVRPAEKFPMWRTADAVHVDLRGLDPPEPMVAILQIIDSNEVDTVLVAYLDREPIFLYPELDDRRWHYEVAGSSHESTNCEDGIMLRMTRLGT